jgi:hypothetical protein
MSGWWSGSSGRTLEVEFNPHQKTKIKKKTNPPPILMSSQCNTSKKQKFFVDLLHWKCSTSQRPYKEFGKLLKESSHKTVNFP